MGGVLTRPLNDPDACRNAVFWFFNLNGKQKKSLTGTLWPSGDDEGRQGPGPDQPAPCCFLVEDGSGEHLPSPQAPHLEHGTTAPPPSIHGMKGEMLSQARHRVWGGETGLGGKSFAKMPAKV